MSRFLTISFMLLALAVGAAGVVPAAHAAGTASEGQTCDPTDTTEGGSAVCESGLVCTTDSGRNTCQQSSTQQPVDPKAAAAAAKNPTEEENKAKNATWGFDWIMTKVMDLFAWLVGVAAITLNYAVYYTVVGMGGYVEKLSAIKTVWTILRDISNILLIFGFLAIGISFIIDSDWYGGGKKLLPTLLIAAVFVNFSLFIAEAVIDVGNLFATQIYTQMSPGGKLPTSDDMSRMTTKSEIISNMIMNKVGLQTIYGNGKVNAEIFKAGNTWLIGFMAIILFIITAFVMFTLALILIARFVALIFIIMLSPVGIAGFAVPGLQGWASKWWDTLFKQTITAPILLLLLYIALSVIADEKFLTSLCSPSAGSTNTSCTPNWVGYVSGNFVGFASMILSFFIAMGLLLAVVYFAKTLSAVGAGWATKTAGKLSFGATAWGMRSTAGWGSQRLSRAVRSSERLRGTKTGRLLATTFDKGAKASFDIRGAKIGGGLKGAGIDAGDAQKDGYRKRLEDSTKAHEAYAKSIEDREPTRSEQRQIDTAKGNRTYAERLHKEASDEHKLTKTETIKLRAEVKHLENLSIKSPETDRALGAAQQKLATSETSLATASTKLTEAAEKLADYKEAEAKIKTDVEAKTSAKAGREAYVQSIQGTRPARFSSWAMFGPGGAVAAKKIIKEKKNTVDLDEMKKWLEEKDKPKDEEGKEEKEEKKTEPKPETPKP